MALYSNAFSVVRQYLSSAVGDLIMGTFDSGTKSTGVDTMLRQANDYYNKHKYRCYIHEGTNVGEEREISDWVKDSSNTLTFDPDYTAAIDNTSDYELHYIFTEDDYRKAINLAIEHLAGKYLVEVKDETTITLVADTYEYALPLTMLYLYKVMTEDEAAGGVFKERDVIDPRDYSIIKSYPPKLKLHEERYSITADKDLRLEGQGAQAIVDDDTDIIYLPPGWVVQKAITFLPEVKVQSNKLERTVAQAELYVARYEPRNHPNPRAQKIVE